MSPFDVLYSLANPMEPDDALRAGFNFTGCYAGARIYMSEISYNTSMTARWQILMPWIIFADFTSTMLSRIFGDGTLIPIIDVEPIADYLAGDEHGNKK